MPFLGRESELSEFDRLYRQNRFHLFILYGRRRVGKTTFLKEFCKNKPSIFYSAEQSNEKLGYPVYQELKDKARAFGRNPSQIWYVLFSKSGFTGSLLEEARQDEHLLLISMEALLSQ